MKILKLLNKIYLLSISIFLIFSLNALSNEPVDIWNTELNKNLEENQVDETVIVNEEKSIENSLYETQLKKKNTLEIQEDQKLYTQKNDVVGLYDPETNGVVIDMWSYSNGSQVVDLIDKLNKVELSKDAKEILDIALLTNSYFPEQNITNEQFLDIKSNWLIKNANLESIKEYLIKNQNIVGNKKMIIFFVNEYLSNNEIEKACSIFNHINPDEDDYLTKFKVYCLINNNQREEAQLILDLKIELGFQDIFFEKKFNYLMGYENDINKEISEKSLLDFHLSHRTNPEFVFEPIESTSKQIWKYLSSANLLESVASVDLENKEKILMIERATHEKNYTEKDLFDLYKRFQFNINQLLAVQESYKLLTNLEARAILYQGILINSEIPIKLKLIKTLKNLFIKDGIENAFSDELSLILKEIDKDLIPSDYSTFYNLHLINEKNELSKIKINNKVIHQSKLLNYFKDNTEINNFTKDVNKFLKNIKRDKDYNFTTKDIILIESLKFDGIKISEKYDTLYETKNYIMPTDIQNLINNNEMGLVLLRLVEVIGMDELEKIDHETLYFIISALNQLNIDPIRNKILLKILPLKV